MAAKKMTKKEFVEVLENAGMYFEHWGYEGILNIVSCHLGECAKEQSKHGLHYAARHSQEQADKIFDALEARGYYTVA